jgi:hypothetical protein
MSPLLRQPNREPRDRTLLTLGIVMAVLLMALLAMPFVARERAGVPPRGLTSHTAPSAV